MITIDQMNEANKLFDSDEMNSCITNLTQVMLLQGQKFFKELDEKAKDMIAPTEPLQLIAIGRACDRLSEFIKKAILDDMLKNPEMKKDLEEIRKNMHTTMN